MASVTFDLYSLTDLRRPGALRALGGAFDADPRLRPDRMDTGDPIRGTITSAAELLAALEGIPATGTESYLYERRAAPRFGGGISFERRPPETLETRHRIYGSIDDGILAEEGDLIDAFAELFVRLADAFDTTYGFATHSKLPWQQRVELVEAGRRGEPGSAVPDDGH